jgi:type IX secretion system PorP/SprF family membrane protein
MSFIHDKIGPMQTTSLFLDYAFRVKLSKKSKLSFGLKGGFNNYSFNLSELSATNTNDVAANLSENTFSPNIGFGIYYSTDNFYAGLSTPKLFQNDYNYKTTSTGAELSTEKMHYYMILGWVVPVDENIKLKPTGFLKVTQGAPIEGDVTLNAIFYDQFHAGLMYRTGDALGALVGYEITDQLFAGYSFDWSFVNSTGKYNAGSHEIVLRYDFIFSHLKRIRSPRYF